MYFELQLDPSSPAEEWFENLPRIEKTLIEDVHMAFTKWWLMKRKMKLSRTQIKQRFKSFILEDDDIAAWDHQHHKFKYVWWAK